MLASYVIPVGAQDPPPEGDDPPALVDGGGDSEGSPPEDSSEPTGEEAPPDEDGPDEGSPPPEEIGLFSTQSGEIAIIEPVDFGVVPGGQVAIKGRAPAGASVLVTIQYVGEQTSVSNTVTADEQDYFAITVTLPDGSYRATASVDDVVSAEIWFDVDMSGPIIEFDYPDYEEGRLTGYVRDRWSEMGPVFLSVNGGAEEPLQIDEYGDFYVTLEGLRSGANRMTIRALDEHGYESTVAFEIPDTYHAPTLTLSVDNNSFAPGETVTVTGNLDWVYPAMTGATVVIKFNPNHLALPPDWDPTDAIRGTFVEGPDGSAAAYFIDETDDEAYLWISVSNWHQVNLLSKTAFTVPFQVSPDVEGQVQTQIAIARANADHDPFIVMIGDGSLPPSMRGYNPLPISFEIGDPPPVRITAPHHDAVVPGAVTVHGKAPANSWVLVTVQKYWDPDMSDETVQADAAGYFTASFTLSDGWYTVTAAIEDFVSAPIDIGVDASGPEISVSFPKYKEDGSVKLTGEIADAWTAVESAYLAVNGEYQPFELDEWDRFEVTLAELRSGANQIQIGARDTFGYASALEFDLPDVYDPPTLSLSVNGTSFRPGDTVTITGNVDWIYPGLTGVGATIAYDPTYLELPPEWDPNDVVVGTFLEGPGAGSSVYTQPGGSDDEAYLEISIWNWGQGNLDSRKAFTVPLRIKEDAPSGVQTSIAIRSASDLNPPFTLRKDDESPLEPDELDFIEAPTVIRISDAAVGLDDPGLVVRSSTVEITGWAPPETSVYLELRTEPGEKRGEWSGEADETGRFAAQFEDVEDGIYWVTAEVIDLPKPAPLLVTVDANGPLFRLAAPVWDGNVVTISGKVIDLFGVARASAEIVEDQIAEQLSLDAAGAFTWTKTLAWDLNRFVLQATDSNGNSSSFTFDLPQNYAPHTFRLHVPQQTYEPGELVIVRGFLSWVPPEIYALWTTLAYDPAVFEPVMDYADTFTDSILGTNGGTGWIEQANEEIPDRDLLGINMFNDAPVDLSSKKAFAVALRVREDAPVGSTTLSLAEAYDGVAVEMRSHEGAMLDVGAPAPYTVRVVPPGAGQIPLTLTSPVVNAHGYVNARPLQVAGTAPAHSDVTVTVRVTYWSGKNDTTYTIRADGNGDFSLTLTTLPDAPTTIFVTAGEESLPPLNFEYDTSLGVDLFHPRIEDGQAIIAARVDELGANLTVTLDPDGAAIQFPMEYEWGGYVTAVPLINGVADVQLTVKDLAGNIVVRRFTVRETDRPAQLRFETDQPSYMPGDLVAVTVHLEPVSPALTGVDFWLSYDPDVLEMVQDKEDDLDLLGSVFGVDADLWVSERDPGFVQIELEGDLVDTETTKLFTMYFRVLQEVPNGDTILSLKSPRQDRAVWLRPANSERDLIPHKSWAMGVVSIGPVEPALRLTLPGAGAFLNTGQVAVEGFAPDGETVTITVVNLDNPDVPAQERFVTAVGGSFHGQFELIDGQYRVTVEAEDADRFVRTFTVDTKSPLFDDVELEGYAEDGRIRLFLSLDVLESDLDALYVQINGDGTPTLAHSHYWSQSEFVWQGSAPDFINFQVILTATDRAGNQTVHVIDVERVALDLRFDKLFYKPGDEVKVSAYLSTVPPDLDYIYLELGFDPNVLAPLHDDGIPQYDVTNSVLPGAQVWGAVSGQLDWVSFELYGDDVDYDTTKIVTLYFRVKETAPLGASYLEVRDFDVYYTDLPTMVTPQFGFLVTDVDGQGGISGKVTLDGATTGAGTVVTAYRAGEPVGQVWTDELGEFVFSELQAGYTYHLVFARDGYLTLKLQDVPVYPDQTTGVSHITIRLTAGNLLDTVQSQDRIYLEDLGAMARALLGNPDAAADLNGDGKVDEDDLQLLRLNYGQAGAGSGEPSAGQVIDYVPVP